MLAQREAVVPCKDDDRVVRLPDGLQRRHHARHLRIRVGDHRVVFGNVAANLFRRARERREQFVADVQRAVIEGVLDHKVRRQRNVVRVVHLQILFGHRARIVRGHKRDVREKRCVIVVAFEEIDGRVAEKLAGMFAGRNVVGQTVGDLIGRVRRAHHRLWHIVLARGVKVAGGHVPMILHPAEEDFRAVGETARVGGWPVVPLACAKGAVARLLQDFSQQHVLRRDVLPFAFEVEERATGHQHRTAGHADRTRRSTHNVRARECRPRVDPPVHRRRVDIGIPQRAQRVEALVVGEEENDIRSLSLI